MGLSRTCGAVVVGLWAHWFFAHSARKLRSIVVQVRVNTVSMHYLLVATEYAEKAACCVQSCFSMFIFPNQYACRRRKHISRHIQVFRCRFVLEHAASEIVRRTVTGAQKATWPVVRKVGLRTSLKTRSRCAAEMRTDAYDD